MAGNLTQAEKTEERPGAERTHTRPVYTPRVDIEEDEHALLLSAEMPGVDENSVNVTLEDGVLTIEGHVEWDDPANYEVVYREFEFGDYHRAFTLSEAIDQAKIEARVDAGVLHLRLPKAQAAKPRKIAVTSG